MTSDHEPSRAPSWIAKAPLPVAIAPGVLLTAGIGSLAFALSRVQTLVVISPIILAVILGAVLRKLFEGRAVFKPGIVFAQKRILRAAIVLLGLQLTVWQLYAIGYSGVVVITVAVVSCLLFTRWFARLIGVDPQLGELIAVGTSICGASAVIAANAVTRAGQEKVAYSLACITLFGTIAMIVEPLLPELLALTPVHYGVWAGASIHEVAQVVAAAFAHSDVAGQMGTTVKLSRVVLLGPTVIALGFFARRLERDRPAKREPVQKPWFVVGFLAMMAVNSVWQVPAGAMAWIAPVTTMMLAMALAALGLEIEAKELRRAGVKPLVLGSASALFIAAVSLALIKLTGG